MNLLRQDILSDGTFFFFIHKSRLSHICFGGFDSHLHIQCECIACFFPHPHTRSNYDHNYYFQISTFNRTNRNVFRSLHFLFQKNISANNNNNNARPVEATKFIVRCRHRTDDFSFVHELFFLDHKFNIAFWFIFIPA